MQRALQVAAALLAIGIVPIWPLGFYTLLRVIVWAIALYLAIAGRPLGSATRTALVILAVLFNPIFVVSMSRWVWLPIDLACAYYFWRLSRSAAVESIPLPDPSFGPAQGSERP
jgi:hypothetical protein